MANEKEGATDAPDEPGDEAMEQQRKLHRAIGNTYDAYHAVKTAIVWITVNKICPASGLPTEQCDGCKEAQDEGIFLGDKPHRHQLAGMIRGLPEKIIEALRPSYPLG